MSKKTLKYILISLFSLFVLLGIIGNISMSNYRKSPEFMVAQMNAKNCPIVLGGNTGEISKITYENGYLVYHICYRDEFADIETIRNYSSNFDEVSGSVFFALNGINSAGSKELFNILNEYQMGIKYAIRNDRGDTCSIVCSFEDIQKAYQSFDGISSTEALGKGIEFNIEMYNRNLPIQLDEWLSLESFSVEGDTLFMNHNVDGDGYDVTEMDFSGVTIFDIEMTDDEKALYEALFGMCKVANCHFAVRYINKDTREEAIWFTDKTLIKQVNTHSYIDRF
ncbi:MAG: hypothetical protein IKW35_01140 [Paludibacteraceae bacterium]|nr:hypothetical protein [Paludibacteraceae bacterium]